MGIRHIATSVELANGLTKFYGKDLNRLEAITSKKTRDKESDRYNQEDRES
jgi:hypothetical protein